MQFKTLAAATLLSLAQAQDVDMHIVSVGVNPVTGETANRYWPDRIEAAPGSMVQFQFFAGSHTVTQSSFDAPCVQLAAPANASNTVVSSGPMPFNASVDTEVPMFTFMVNDTTPMWLYCATGPHCSLGMVMVINENTGANATRSLETHRELAMATGDGAAPPPAPGTPTDPGAPPAHPGAPAPPPAHPDAPAPGIPGSPVGTPGATPPPSAGNVNVAGWSSLVLAIASAMLLL